MSMTIQSSVKDKILATSSETSKVENTPAEMLRDLDQQMEKTANDAYRLRLPEELSGVHDTFHVSNLKKCLADASLHMPLDEIKVEKTLRFIEEPVENSDCQVLRFLTSLLDDGRGSGSWMFLFVWSGYAAMRTLLWASKVVSSKISCES
ncbi:hypothetical protein Tco_1335488 [Tanacetum coccineum]